ncbi:phosphopantetheine-binding protein, partial [Streptosporangium sp. NPDC023615]|uniref:phosphopantetheine-binding protein n=1 Tax=Streptosporangium sp. NPDC023615 TaxID=3154794 RepID=UPI003420C311
PVPVLAGAGGRAPESQTERVLAEIFRDVLRLERELSVDDDFFRLGGDSILAARLVSAALARELSLTLRDVLEHRTVGGLAGALPAPPADQVDQFDQEPVPAPVSATLDRLRESGADPNAWVYTETFELPGHPELRAAYAAVVAGTDALRMSVQCVSRRLWLSHILPTAPAAVTELAPADDADLAALRAAATDLVDITIGRPSALAFVRTPTRTVVSLAVHAGAADRASVHRLVDVLRSDVPVEWANTGLAPALQAVEEAGAATGTSGAEEWLDLLKNRADVDQNILAPGRAETFDWVGPRGEGAVRNAVRRALWVTGANTTGGLVDEEVAMVAGAGSTPPGPFTATVPLPVDDEDRTATVEFPLLRHHNQAGRRALRRAPVPQVLITRVHGPAADRPEGVETLYRAVIRYHLGPDATTITMLGFDASVTKAVRDALTGTVVTSI